MPVEITGLNEDHTPAWQSEGRLHDLSAGGCAFYHSREIPVGERLDLCIVLDPEHARKWKTLELHARGAVIRCTAEGDKHLIGVRFMRFHEPPDDRKG